MAKGSHPPPGINIAVVGVPSVKNKRTGIGKSCLIDRFLHQHENEYRETHSVVISQQDYSSTVVNSSHFLYWGYKDFGGGVSELGGVASGGKPYQLHFVEHTEFIDDSSDKPFHSALSYNKRATAQKLVSKGKVAYINPDQMALPESYVDAPKFPDKFTVDVYIVCIDASDFTDNAEQKDFLQGFMPELLKTKKPYIIALTKCDIASLDDIKAASEYASKQKKIQLPIVEVSAAKNVNVTTAVIFAGSLGNQKLGISRPKFQSFAEGNKVRQEQVTKATEKLKILLKNVAKDYYTLVPETLEVVDVSTDEGKEFVSLKGTTEFKRVIKRHIEQLEEEARTLRYDELIKKLKDVLRFCVPVVMSQPPPRKSPESIEADLTEFLDLLKKHEKFTDFFFVDDGSDVTLTSRSSSTLPTSASRNLRVSKWSSASVLKRTEERIPLTFLQLDEVKALMTQYIAEARKRRVDQELLTTIESAFEAAKDRVLPGTPFEELFAMASCEAEANKVQDRESLNKVYNTYMRQLDTKYGEKLQELFLEHPELFLAPSSPEGDKMKESMERMERVHEALKDNERYKILDGRQQFRQNALMKHTTLLLTNTGGTLMEDPLIPVLAEQSFKLKMICPNTSEEEDEEEEEEEGTSSNSRSLKWILEPSDAYIQLALVGQRDSLGKLRQDIMSQCSETGKLERDDKVYYLHMELFEDFNSLTNYAPQGGIVLVDSLDSLEKFDSASKEFFLADSAAGTIPPYFGMPLLLVALGEKFTQNNSREWDLLMQVVSRLQCGLIVEPKMKVLARLLKPDVAKKLLTYIVSIINKTATILNSAFTPGLAELQIMICSLPGDLYDRHNIGKVWSTQPLSLCHSKHKSQVVQVSLPDRNTHIHVSIRAESMLNVTKLKPLASQNDYKPLHGYIVLYSTTRRASFLTAKYLLQNVLYAVPTILVAVPPTGGHLASKPDSDFVEEGSKLAKSRENVKFIKVDESWQVGCLNSFYTLCWDKRFSSTNLQKGFNRKTTPKRELPTIPPRLERSVSPLPNVDRGPGGPANRHSVHFGTGLPTPHKMTLPQKEDTSQIVPTCSDSDEEPPVAETVKINLPEGGYTTVPRSPAPDKLIRQGYEEEEEVQYTLPTEVMTKPDLATLRAAHISKQSPHVSTKPAPDGDYAEPINSIRIPGKKKSPPQPPVRHHWLVSSDSHSSGTSGDKVSHPPEPESDPQELYATVNKSTDKKTVEPVLNPEELYAPVLKNRKSSDSTQPSETNPEELYAPVIKNRQTREASPQTEQLYAPVMKPKKPSSKPPPPLTKPKPKVASKPGVSPPPVNQPTSGYEPLYDLPEVTGVKKGSPAPQPATGTHRHKTTISQSESTSPSPKTKKKGLFRGFRNKDESKVTPPSSPHLLAQEAIKKAATLPKDFVGLPSSRESPTQLSPSDVDSGVYDPDHGVDEVPEIPERPDDLGMSDDDSPPPVPPRQYLSDFESDNEDEAADDDEGEMIKTIYDCLARAGGPSRETEKLYDTLDQYRKVHLREKNEPKGDYSEVSHGTTSDVPIDEGQYATVQEALEEFKKHSSPMRDSPVRDSPVRELSAKERKQNLKVMKQAAKQMERQKKIDEKKRKREEEQQRKEDEKKRKAEIKKNRQSKKRTSSVKKKKAIVEEVRNIYFSSSLESIVTTESPVPDFVVKCAELVKRDGMDTVGIYRVSGKHDDVKIIHDKYEQDPNVDIGALDLDITSTSSAMKAFFKLLPDPLISTDVTQEVLSVLTVPSEHDEKLAQILLKMPRFNLKTLSFLCHHLHELSENSEVNKMTASNLAIVFWPTLMRPPILDLANPTRQLEWQKIMTTMIERPGCIPDPDLESAN